MSSDGVPTSMVVRPVSQPWEKELKRLVSELKTQLMQKDREVQELQTRLSKYVGTKAAMGHRQAPCSHRIGTTLSTGQKTPLASHACPLQRLPHHDPPQHTHAQHSAGSNGPRVSVGGGWATPATNADAARGGAHASEDPTSTTCQPPTTTTKVTRGPQGP